MHSKIFQITEESPLKDNILNDCTLEQGDGHYYDYCSRCGLEKCTNLKNTSKIRLIQVINSIWTSCASMGQPNNPMSSCVWRAN